MVHKLEHNYKEKPQKCTIVISFYIFKSHGCRVGHVQCLLYVEYRWATESLPATLSLKFQQHSISQKAPVISYFWFTWKYSPISMLSQVNVSNYLIGTLRSTGKICLQRTGTSHQGDPRRHIGQELRGKGQLKVPGIMGWRGRFKVLGQIA